MHVPSVPLLLLEVICPVHEGLTPAIQLSIRIQSAQLISKEVTGAGHMSHRLVNCVAAVHQHPNNISEDGAWDFEQKQARCRLSIKTVGPHAMVTITLERPSCFICFHASMRALCTSARGKLQAELDAWISCMDMQVLISNPVLPSQSPLMRL